MSTQDAITEAAIAWHLAIAREAADHRVAVDWDAFTLWLEANPRHAQTYDEIALIDSALADHGSAIAPAAAQGVAPLRRRALAGRAAWLSGAVAAAALVMVSVPMLRGERAVEYTTGGAARKLALSGGVSVTLAPHSTLRSSDRDRALALDGGAWFDVAHDPGRKLEIAAGGVTVADIGTRFDIQAAGGVVRIAVSEGKLVASSDALASPVPLAGGQALAFDRGAGRSTVSRVDPGAAGSWQRGQLAYDDAPLALVAADLARYADVRVVVPDNLASRRFSGSLALGGGHRPAHDLAAILGLDLVADGAAYRLTPLR